MVLIYKSDGLYLANQINEPIKQEKAMNTFHITPKDPLAELVADDVAALAVAGVVAVAIRGDEHGVYGVFEAPEDYNSPRSGYLWGYVCPREWLEEFIRTSPSWSREVRGYAKTLAAGKLPGDDSLPFWDRVGVVERSAATKILFHLGITQSNPQWGLLLRMAATAVGSAVSKRGRVVVISK